MTETAALHCTSPTTSPTAKLTMLHCFGAEHCGTASIAGALGLKIIDLFDQQSGPQGHADYSGYSSYSCDSRLTAADLAAIRHANVTNAPLLSRNETTTITPAHTENSAEIRQRYEMPEPYLEPLALGRSPYVRRHLRSYCSSAKHRPAARHLPELRRS